MTAVDTLVGPSAGMLASLQKAGLVLVNPTRIVIGLGSKARQGKNEAAETMMDYAREKYGFRSGQITIAGYADELYRMCREFFGMKEKDAPLLQKVGCMLRDHWDTNYWVKALERRVPDECRLLIVTDMRFPNEMEWVRTQGGVTVNVQRWVRATRQRMAGIGDAAMHFNETRFIANDRPADHPSETALDNAEFDYTIRAYSVDELRRDARGVLDSIMEER